MPEDPKEFTPSGADEVGKIGKQDWELPHSVSAPPEGWSTSVETTSYEGEDHLTDYHPPVDAHSVVYQHPFKTTRFINEDDELMVRVRIGRFFYSPNTIYISKIAPHGPHGEQQLLVHAEQASVDANPEADPPTDAVVPVRVAVVADNYPPVEYTTTTDNPEAHNHKVTVSRNPAYQTQGVATQGTSQGVKGEDVLDDNDFLVDGFDGRNNPLGLWPQPDWHFPDAATGGGVSDEFPGGQWGWESTNTSGGTETFGVTALLSGEGNIPAQFFSAKANEVEGFGTKKNMYAEFEAFEEESSMWLMYILKVDTAGSASPELYAPSFHYEVQLVLKEGTAYPGVSVENLEGFGGLGNFQVAVDISPNDLADGVDVDGNAIPIHRKEIMLANSPHGEDADIRSIPGFAGEANIDAYNIGVYYIKIAEIPEVEQTAEEGEEDPVVEIDQIIHDNIYMYPTWVAPSGELPTAPGFGEDPPE
jgi:hypothetical protein